MFGSSILEVAIGLSFLYLVLSLTCTVANETIASVMNKRGKSMLALFVTKIFGLVITVFAVALGAPFWFDTLSRFINIRGAGTPPGEPKRSVP